MPDISVSTVLLMTCFLTFGISEGKKGDGSSLFHKEIARKTDDLSPSEREKALVSGSFHSADTSGSIASTLEPQGCMPL